VAYGDAVAAGSAEQELPQLRFDELLTALMCVTEEIVRQRPPEYREVPSRETLPARVETALVSMRIVATQRPNGCPWHTWRICLLLTVLPEGHLRLLKSLRRATRLVWSQTLIMARRRAACWTDHGLSACFRVIVISDDFGQRKPHHAIFEAALRELGVSADETLFIGDSLGEDVSGARNAQLRVAWLNPNGEPVPADGVHRTMSSAAWPT